MAKDKPNALFGDEPPVEPLPDTTQGERGTILERWDLSVAELTELIDTMPSVRGMMMGAVAELKLREILEDHPEVTATIKHDDHNRKKKGDRHVTYKGQTFSVESKSLQTNSIEKAADGWRGDAQCDASDKREVTLKDGTKLLTTNLLRGEFDILAVNCFAFENEWRFVFALNSDLPCSRYKKYTEEQRCQLLATLIPVTWPPKPPFVDDIFPLIEKLHAERAGRR